MTTFVSRLQVDKKRYMFICLEEGIFSIQLVVICYDSDVTGHDRRKSELSNTALNVKERCKQDCKRKIPLNLQS